jgi:DNA-binding transcriptional ArsR family regulator
MVWRIHFTADDLERIQVRPTLGPLTEAVKAMSLLRCQRTPKAQFRPWLGQVKGRITAQMAALAALLPPCYPGVDLPMLIGEAPTVELGIQALMTAPSENVLVEIEYVNRMTRLPAAAWAVAEPGGPGRVQLADAARAAHRALVEPYWTRISGCLHAEHAARRRALASGGPDELLSSLQSRWLRWNPPVLEVLRSPPIDVHLSGRGIALVPSVFVGTLPQLHQDPTDPAAPPWLVLPPAEGRLAQASLWAGRRPRGAALAALVGRNRAAVLGAIAGGCTTTELARQVGISLAAASQHASVLRAAGLITTHRQGSAVLHVLTPLGTELLQAG